MHTNMSDIRGPLAETVPLIERHVADKRNTLFVGHPGSLGVVLARRITSIMPPMTAVQTEHVQDAYDAMRMDRVIDARPFRAPHYTCSTAGIMGTNHTGDGELGLARHGVLLFDELPEFKRATIGVASIQIDQMGDARPLVVGTSAPCPCGWNGYGYRVCNCSDMSIKMFQDRLRSYAQLFNMLAIRLPETARKSAIIGEPAESSAIIQSRVATAWAL